MKIRADCRAAIYGYAQKLAQFKSDEAWWLNKGTAADINAYMAMVPREWKEFENNYNNKIKENVLRVRSLLISHINIVPPTDRNIEEKYNPPTGFLMPMFVEDQLKDLCGMLNEFERENGLALSCTEFH